MGRLKKRILLVMSGAIAAVVVMTAVIASVTTMVAFTSVASRKAMEATLSTTSSGGYLTGIGNGMDGLTAFSYFCIYEGGSQLYDSVLGDGGNGCGAYGFDYRYDLQPFLDYCYNSDPIRYASFYPYTSYCVSKGVLQGNTGLAAAWHSVYAAYPEAFSAIQDQYVKETKYAAIEAYHMQRGLDLSIRPDVIKGLCTSIHNRKGYETSKYSYITKSGVTNETSDEDFIRMLCDCFGTRGGYIYQRYCVDYSSGACGLLCEKNMALLILQGNYGTGNLGTGASAEVINEVPYYNQGDYAHVAFHNGSVQSSGCGITCFSMVASYYCRRTITPEETAPWAMANGADTVSNWGAFSILAEHYGFKVQQQAAGSLWGGSSDPVINALMAGKLVIASHTGGYFNPSGSGHYVLYIGITSSGNIIVYDPGSRARTQECQNGIGQNTALSNCKQYWIFSK